MKIRALIMVEISRMWHTINVWTYEITTIQLITTTLVLLLGLTPLGLLL